ncbi:MAG: hypothetical protein GX066_02810 [Clostridiaceae bacterium]|nr:hypothetical protein [Clostridiaceae bacterium]
MRNIKKTLLVLTIMCVACFIFIHDEACAETTVININPEESYEFINNDTSARSISITLSGSEKSYDYAIYNQDGTENKQGISVSTSSLTIPAKGRLVITGQKGQIACRIDNLYIISSISNEPALSRVTVKAGESYAFINNDTVSHQIVNEGSSSSNKFDYAIYTRNGKEYDQKINNGYTSSITVPAGGRLIVTSLNGNIDFGGYYNFFVVEKSSDPALRRVTVKVGESYEFINTDIEEHEIRTNVNVSTTRFDYAIYNSDGTAYNQVMNSLSASLTIPAGGRVIVTPTTVDMDFGGYYNFFVTEKSNDPALRRVAVNPGESYEFINTDRVEHELMTPLSLSEYYNYAIYNSDGTEYKQDIYCKLASLTIPAGGRVVVTPLNDSRSFAGYYKFFTAKKSDEPALRAVTLKPGASYEFKNNDTVEHEMMYSANSGRYDYAIYNSDGTVYGQGLNNGSGVVSGSITLPAGGRMIITSLTNNTYFGGYYKFFTSQKSNEPALSKATIKPGETYTFINTASVNLPVLTTSSSSKRIDVYAYDSNGTEVLNKTSTYGSKIEIPAGGKLLIKSLSSDIECGGYHDYFTSFYNDNESGINWTNTLSSTGNLYAITQGNDKYVAVGTAGAI